MVSILRNQHKVGCYKNVHFLKIQSKSQSKGQEKSWVGTSTNSSQNDNCETKNYHDDPKTTNDAGLGDDAGDS